MTRHGFRATVLDMTTAANFEASQQAFIESRYPRCTRCNLRTYVHVFTGVRVDAVTGSAQCPGYNLPDEQMPVYPYIGSAHTV